MFRPIDDILVPDRRYAMMISVDRSTGATRSMEISDLYDMVAPIELSSRVPNDIREQFDKARNAFVYSWFAYDLATLAEQQVYAVVEMALRERLGPETVGGRGLARLIKRAIAQGHLNPADFNPAPGVNLLDMLPLMRNELAHGSTNLMPFGTPDILGLGAEIINKLFPS